MRLAGDLDPIGQLVVVGVGIVEKATLLDQQTARILAWPVAAIPAEGTLAGRALERFDRPRDTVALFVLAEAEVLLPSPSVAADVVAPARDRLGDPRIALERDRAAEDGERQTALSKKAKKTPHADPAPEFVHRLEGKIALAGGDATAWRFGQSKSPFGRRRPPPNILILPRS